MKIFSLVFTLFVFTTLTAQTWMESAGVLQTDNFETIRTKGHAYFDSNPDKKKQISFSGFQYDSQYKRFRRWEHYWKDRVTEQGDFPDFSWNEWRNNLAIARQSSNKRAAWVNINQTVPGTNTGYDGMGRTTSIAFHPTNASTFIVSGAIGGLWLTTDGGNTYATIGDNLPYMAIADVAYHPQSPNTIYAATGDAIWYGLPSLGLLKSTDLGATWQNTGLNFNLSADIRIRKILVDPSNGEVIFACADNGLHKSTDGGQNWTIVNAGLHWDIVYQPGSTSTLFALGIASGDLEVFKSTDSGASFTQVSSTGMSNSEYNTSFLSVSADDPDVLYYLNGNNNTLFKTSNAGGTFSTANNGMPGDDGLIASNNDADRVYCGSLNNHRSDNGGSSFTQKSLWYNSGSYPTVHADTRRMLTNPLQNDLIYVCNDGGVYIYDEIQDSWTEKSAGLIITQYYSVATSQTNVDRISAGSQDNGTRIRNNDGTWRALNAGDGMDVAIDNTDQNIVYCTYVNGQLYRSLDGWVNDVYNEITPTDNGSTISGNWVTRYVLDPSDNSTILAAYDDIYRSTNMGDTWTKVSNNLSSGNLTDVAVSPIDQDYIYTCRGAVMYYTDDLGLNWNTRPLPASQAITSIASSPYNTNTVCVALSGYNASKKVYRSTDNGLNWVNISTGLPNVPVNKIIYQNGGNGLIYAGTDLGMYYYDGAQWNAINQDLPLTQVTDIDIQYADGKIRIGTHGRGVFESDILDPIVGINETVSNLDIKLYPNPTNDGLIKLELYNLNDAAVMSIHDLNGRLMFSKEVKSGINLVDVSDYSTGMYTVSIQESNSLSVRKLVVE